MTDIMNLEINIKTCRKVLSFHEENDVNLSDQQAAAWKVVNEFCIQEGMKLPPDGKDGISGIERVIDYIGGLKKKTDRYDELIAKIDKCYDDESEADLVDIGEITSYHLGYM